VYRKTGGQPKPSISICPNCQQPKDPGSALCLNCNTRSCPNGHIIAVNAAICAKCGWEDHQWKYQPKTFIDTSTFTPGPQEQKAAPIPNRCPLCGSRLDPKSAYCPTCGNLVTGESSFTGEDASAINIPRMSTPASPPPRVESYTVTQEVIGHKDKRRNYYCPRCQSKVDDPRPGLCPHCGFVGTMQYDIYQHQPQWASEQAAPTYNQAAMRQASAPQRPPSRPASGEESKCPSCGAPNPVESRFCRTCGYRYGIGRISHLNRSMSTDEWSATTAAAGPAIFEPIYQGAGGEAPAIEVRMPKGGGAPPRERKGKEVRVKEYGAKKFPLGLLMAIMIVVALIIALAIFVISRQFAPETPPVSLTSDKTPPIISDINITSITDTSAEVTWVTDEPSTSQIMLCDPEGLCTWTDPDTTLVKSHSVTLSNISETINYHLTIKSTDQSGNEGTFERDQSFSGGTPTDKTPPAISDVLSDKVTDMGVIISWKTDEPSSSKIEYGETKNYGSVATDSKMVTQHSVLILGLKADTVYWYKVVSQDSEGNSNDFTSASTYFKTLTAVTLGLEVGNRAPDFTLKDLPGNDVTLSSFRGKKAVMINFWYTTCGPCVAEMPYIQNIYTSWSGDTPLQILGVNIFDNTAIAQAFMQSKGYTFPVLIDTSNQAENLYNVKSAPVTYFLDIQGIIKYKKEGNFASQSDIEAVLNSL
jgi:peroxiredoxin/chitodextrinase/ribosomal protein L37E